MALLLIYISAADSSSALACQQARRGGICLDASIVYFQQSWRDIEEERALLQASLNEEVLVEGQIGL